MCSDGFFGSRRCVGLKHVAAVLATLPVSAIGQESNDAEPEEVVVTGSHIRNPTPVGVQPIIVTQEDIQTGGFTRIEEVLRAVPQNFPGGPREDTYVQDFSDRANTTNLSKGATVNLRGMGAGATLVLVNGRRLSPSGTTGLFTDVSNLSLSSVERIEILTDGASALYGSDAVGGVVNVIMRKDYRGAETTIRTGRGSGDVHEHHLSQLLGAAWGSGTASISLDLVDRDALLATSRPFSSSSDQRNRGGDNFSSTAANPGTIFVGTRSFAIPANQNGVGLMPDDFVEGTVNYLNNSENLAILPEQTRRSATVYLSQDVGERIDLSLHGFATERESEAMRPWQDWLSVPSSNPFYVNPIGGTEPIIVRYDLTEDFGLFSRSSESKSHSLTLGVDVDVGSSWRVRTDLTQGKERAFAFNDGVSYSALDVALADPNPDTAYNPFGDGAFTNAATIDSIRSRSRSSVDSEIQTTSVIAEGPLATLRAGEMRLAAGAEYREYSYLSTTVSGSRSGSRSIDAIFAELRVPLIDESNRRPGVYELTFSAASRREEYSDYGSATVPKIGISWFPVRAVRLRATWSESFRAPDLESLDESRNSFSIRAVPDSLSPTGTSTILRWTGGNSELSPEMADNFTFGVDFDVPRVPRLHVGLTYFNIRYFDRLQFPSTPRVEDYLNVPHFSPYVIRNPDAALRERVCNSGSPIEGNREACMATPIDAVVDQRMSNTAKVVTDGVDLDVNYSFESSIGAFDIGLSGTRIFGYKQATLEGLPYESLLNRKYAPVDTRLRARASWERNAWTATAFLNHVGDYQDESPTLTRDVSSWTTVDLNVAYEWTAASGLLSGASISLNVQNAFRKDPPFVNTALGYDIANANPYGRIVSALIRKRW